MEETEKFDWNRGIWRVQRSLGEDKGVWRGKMGLKGTEKYGGDR